MANRRHGKTNQRGYGMTHRNLRARLAPRVASGKVRCARCHEMIRSGEPWDLGHDRDDRTKYSGPEHARCNRNTAEERSARRATNSEDHPAPWRSPAGLPVSRQWCSDYISREEWLALSDAERVERRKAAGQ